MGSPWLGRCRRCARRARRSPGVRLPHHLPYTTLLNAPRRRTSAVHKHRTNALPDKTHGLTIVAPAPAIKKTCPIPLATITAASLKQLDPTGARTRLFDKLNPEAAKLGDILLVRQRTGDPFAGVCIDIRRRGVDTAILLRGQLTRVGVEMWYKVYSPLVEGIEVVQRAAKRARRARLTYMRDVKHDRGSVENVVRVYLRQKASLGAGEGKKKGAEKQKAMQSGKKKGGKKVNNRR
jgi:large subunit ribosomal protein L19